MKQTGLAKGGVKRILLADGTAFALYVLLLALGSLLVVRGMVGEERMGALISASAFLAAFAGTTLATRGAENKARCCVVFAAVFIVVVALLGFLANDSLNAARLGAVALASLLGGATAYFLFGGKKKRKHGGRRKAR